jgi:hypothetical protein
MGLRYTAEFTNIREKDYKVEIYDTEHSGGSTTLEIYGQSGVMITWQSPSDKSYNLIKSSSASVEFVIDNASKLSVIQEIASSNEGRFRIKIYYQDDTSYNLYWAGFVLPDMINYKDDAYPFSLKISAVCAIGFMKDRPFANADGTPIDQRFKIKDLITKCFELTGVLDLWGANDIFLQTYVKWFESTTMTAEVDDPCAKAGIYTTPLNEYNDGEFKPKNILEVLNIVCNLFHARIILDDGKYVFEQMPHLADLTLKRFNYKTDNTAHTTATETNALFIALGEIATNDPLNPNNSSAFPGFYDRTHSYSRSLRELTVDWKGAGYQEDGNIYPLYYNSFINAPANQSNPFDNEYGSILSAWEYAQTYGPYLIPSLQNWQNLGYTSEPSLGGEIQSNAADYKYRIKGTVRFIMRKTGNNATYNKHMYGRFARLPIKVYIDNLSGSDQHLQIKSWGDNGQIINNTDISPLQYGVDNMPNGESPITSVWGPTSSTRMKVSSGMFAISQNDPIGTTSVHEVEFDIYTPNIDIDGFLKVVCDNLSDIKLVDGDGNETAQTNNQIWANFGLSIALPDFKIYLYADGELVNNSEVLTTSVDGSNTSQSAIYNIADTVYGDGPTAAGYKCIWINTSGNNWQQSNMWNVNGVGDAYIIQKRISLDIMQYNRYSQQLLKAKCIEPYFDISGKYNRVSRMYKRGYDSRAGSNVFEDWLFNGGTYNLGMGELAGGWQMMVEAPESDIVILTNDDEPVILGDPKSKVFNNAGATISQIASQESVTKLTDALGIDPDGGALTTLNVEALDFDLQDNTQLILIDTTARKSQVLKLSQAESKGATTINIDSFTPAFSFGKYSRIVIDKYWVAQEVSKNVSAYFDLFTGCSFYDNLGTTRHYLPFYSTLETTSSSVDDVNLLATHDGYFDSFILRTDNGINAAGTITIAAYHVRKGLTTVTLLEAQALAVDSATNKKAMSFKFTSTTAIFKAGDRLLIEIQCSSGVSTASRYWYGSLLLKYKKGTNFTTTSVN